MAGWLIAGLLCTVSAAYGAGRGPGKLGCGLVLALALLAVPALAGPRIVALGDSLVHGYGLPPNEGFVPQLNDWLAAHGAVEAEVANAGVSGDTTAGGLARLDWALGEGADALIVVLGGNDLLRGIDPAVSRSNLDQLIGAARARGLPVLIGGMAAPGNYGPDYKAAFDAIYPELAEIHGALLHQSFLGPVVEDRSLWQPDELHPNAEGVARIVEAIGPRVLDLIDAIPDS